ncbi:MAG: SoxR reducing system RseC family protein [Deltaproteobacteria bacterium]|nr:SoxR reducing system RseC family protein [Deltaproteobacteria bacterium]
MIEEQGVVIDIKGNRAFVKTEKGTSCESCVARETCHGTIGTNEVIIEADNTVNAKFGDRVVIMVGTATLLKASFILYLGPIAGLILGVVIGQILVKQFTISINPDLLSGIMGALFLIITFFGIRLYGKSLEKKEGFRPVVVRVV